MTAVARIGDSFACKDFVAQGSPDVFVNNKPVARKGDETTGHECNVPTIIEGPCSPNVFANNKPIASLNFSKNKKHKCGSPPGSGHQSTINKASPDVFVNGS